VWHSQHQQLLPLLTCRGAVTSAVLLLLLLFVQST
jgi:hypothetical protein